MRGGRRANQVDGIVEESRTEFLIYLYSVGRSFVLMGFLLWLTTRSRALEQSVTSGLWTGAIYYWLRTNHAGMDYYLRWSVTAKLATSDTLGTSGPPDKLYEPSKLHQVEYNICKCPALLFHRQCCTFVQIKHMLFTLHFVRSCGEKLYSRSQYIVILLKSKHTFSSWVFIDGLSKINVLTESKMKAWACLLCNDFGVVVKVKVC